MKQKITPRARKTKNGFSIYLDKYVNGKRTYETIFKNVKANEKNRKLVEAENAINKILKNYNSYSLFDLLDEYYNSYLQKDYRVIKAVINKFKLFLKEDILISDLKIEHVKNFRYYLSNLSKLKGETPSSYSIRFMKILNYLYDKDLINIDLLNSFKTINKFSNIPKEILSKDEFEHLYNNLDKDSEVQKAFLFSCLSGLGLAEIRRLKHEHIKNGILKIKRSKTDNFINIELSDKALKLIDDKNNSDYVFNLNQNTEDEMSDYKVNNYLKEWLEKFKINKHITYYCARHTYCNFLFETAYNSKSDYHGVLYVVSKAMGHSEMYSTFRYLNNYNKDVNSLTSSIN